MNKTTSNKENTKFKTKKNTKLSLKKQTLLHSNISVLVSLSSVRGGKELSSDLRSDEVVEVLLHKNLQAVLLVLCDLILVSLGKSEQTLDIKHYSYSIPGAKGQGGSPPLYRRT